MTYQVNADELRYSAGTSNKFYRTYVIDRGAGDTIAVIQYGRIGAHGRIEIAGTPGRSLAATKRQQKRARGYQPHTGRTFEVDSEWFDDAYQRGDEGVIGVRLSTAFSTAAEAPTVEPDVAVPEPAPARKPRTRRSSSPTALLTRGEDLLNEVLASPDPLEQAGAVLQYVADVETLRTTLGKADNFVSMLTEKVRSAV